MTPTTFKTTYFSKFQYVIVQDLGQGEKIIGPCVGLHFGESLETEKRNK